MAKSEGRITYLHDNINVYIDSFMLKTFYNMRKFVFYEMIINVV